MSDAAPTLALPQHEGGNTAPTLNPSPKMREGLNSSPLPSSWGKGQGDGGALTQNSLEGENKWQRVIENE